MKLVKENITRKLDSLGRISVPKPIRQRLNIADLAEMEFFTMEDNGRYYICMSDVAEKDGKYATAAQVLVELGLEVPAALMEKVDNE